MFLRARAGAAVESGGSGAPRAPASVGGHQHVVDVQAIEDVPVRVAGEFEHHLDVVLAHPPEFELMPDIMDQAREQARKYKTGFEIVHDMEEACKDADIIYAKSWGPLLTTNDQAEGKRIQDQYKDWIADDAKIALGKDDVIYMHPLPADREIEVSNSVIDGPHSVVFDEAEHRLHAQKAVMALTMR